MHLQHFEQELRGYTTVPLILSKISATLSLPSDARAAPGTDYPIKDIITYKDRGI
jgi:hypothetical protein